MAAIRGRPVLMQRFPSGVDGLQLLPEAGAEGAPRLAGDVGGEHAERHHVGSAGRSRPRPHRVGGEPRLPRVPRVAQPRVRRRPRRRAAHRPRPATRPRVRRGARSGTRAQGVARRARHPWLAQDHGQPRHPRVHASRTALDADRGAPRRGGSGARAGATPARRDHRRVVEGRARRPRLRRLQPERAAQDGVRRLVDPGARRRGGVDPVPLGRARRHRSRGVHRARPCPAGSKRAAIRGPTSPRIRRCSRRCSRCTTATSHRDSRTRRGRPSTRRCPANRPRVAPSRARKDDDGNPITPPPPKKRKTPPRGPKRGV